MQKTDTNGINDRCVHEEMTNI